MSHNTVGIRRLRRRHISWLSLLLVVFITLGQYYGWFDRLASGAESAQPGTYLVLSSIDGDTIAVNMNGHEERIRFIGVDTPETHKPNTPIQCGGPEAAAYTKALVQGRRVRLASDPLSSNRDRYDRLLRYVYTPDGTLLNERLITSGHGFAYTYFPFTKSALFIKGEANARKTKSGLWSYCHPEPNAYGGYTSNPLR